MAGFIRRFTFFPALDVITEIEGVVIVDLTPPGVFVGRRTGTVCLVGEWPKGPYNTPTLVESSATIRDVFGGFSLSMRNPLAATTNPYSNGCAFTWLKGKKFRRLVLVRVNMQLANTVTITLGGTPTPTDRQITLPAGTRIRNPGTPTEEFALAQDVVWAEGVVIGTGPQAFTEGVPQTLAQITGVPVYSVQGNSAAGIGSVTQVDATDLQRAGIGTGTPLPNQTIAVTNPAALNVLSSANIDTAYQNALNSTLPGNAEAADNVEIIASARQSQNIRTFLLQNAVDASAVGTGRTALTRPPIGTNLTTASGAADPGVGANRGDRLRFCYPHVEQFIPEIAELDPGETISSANILIGFDAAVASLASNLAPERNLGQSTQEVVSGGLLSWIRDLEPGLTAVGQPTNFTQANYVTMKESGIMGARRDPRISEWIVQSDVTSVDPDVNGSLASGKRRRFADFVQDSLATIALKYNKLPRTSDREDSIIGEITDFLELLKSENNPAAQRIEDFAVDSITGNTAELSAAGIFVIIVEVRMLSTMDAIVFQTTIGESVEVSSAEQLAA